MKKLIITLLALGLVTTGCTAKDTEPQTEPAKQEEAKQEEAKQPELTKEQEDSLWELTPAFPVEVTGADGQKVTHQIIGEPGRFGFIAAPFAAGKPGTYVWHFWDKKAALPGKTLTIKAKHKDDPETQEIVSAQILGPLNGADAHLPTDITLPKAGKNRLDIFVDGKPYGGVIVDVK